MDAETLLIDLAKAYRGREPDEVRRAMDKIVHCPAVSAFCLLTLLDMVEP